MGIVFILSTEAAVATVSARADQRRRRAKLY
jgi:hypothetical protein